MDTIPLCLDCEVVVRLDEYFCLECAEIRKKRYCKFCNTYAYFRHTEETSISFGIPEGSSRWSQSTRIYGQPVCEYCERSQSHISIFEYFAVFGWIPIWIFIVLNSNSEIWLFLGMIICPIFTFIIAIICIYIFDPDPKNNWMNLENHLDGLYVTDEEKNRQKSLQTSPGIPMYYQFKDLESSEKYSKDEKIVTWSLSSTPRKQDWVRLCSDFGIKTENSTIKIMQQRIEAYNKLVIHLRNSKEALSRAEHCYFASEHAPLVMMSKRDLVRKVKDQFPELNTKGMDLIELLNVMRSN
jgi:hypothetical protein